MRQKNRRAELAERLRNRLAVLEKILSSPSTVISDEKFEAVRTEAVKIRDMLKMLD